MIYDYYIYILSNTRNTVVYVGISNNLNRRISEHKAGHGSQFVKKYNVTKLVYFEMHSDPENAIKREKQIKNYSRERKNELINKDNPQWREIVIYP